MRIHTEVWLAAASLHEAGRLVFSSAELLAEVKRLFRDTRPGVVAYVTCYANGAANSVIAATVYNYILRIERGIHRLTKTTDMVHPSRAGSPLWPDQAEVDQQYWPLWHKWRAWQQNRPAAEAAAAAMPASAPEPESDAPARLAAYVRSLSSFRLEQPPATGYDHMGAIITEAILQAGPGHGDPAVDTLPGIGPKTADYLQILAGIDPSAVDRHLALLVEQAGIRATTRESRKQIIEAAAGLLAVDKAVLHYSIWLYMSNRSRGPAEPFGDRPWWWEGNIQAQIVTYLVRSGYSIIRAADIASREAGKDIIARGPDGPLLWVTVKGFPGKTANVQARHWFASAVFDLLVYRGENPNVELALGLPDGYGTYAALVKRINWLRRQMPFTIYWVTEAGDVRAVYGGDT